jgi:O-methyltransferase domain/Dimerisation domain
VTDERTELSRLLSAYRISQAIHVAAVLGIADLFADGPRSVDELAESTATHPDTLYRLLRALAGAGVFTETDERRFASNPLGDGLRSDAPGSLRDMAILLGQPYLWTPWSHLLDSVRTGENAFRHVHGESVWDYREAHPEESAVFDRAMAAGTAAVDRALIDAYDFSRFRSIVDVGGGTGALLRALLAAYPNLHGVLFDRPHVVNGVRIERGEVVAGSFFESVPAGADAYLLKWIIHDWEDEESVAILRSIRKAIPAGGVLLVVDRILGGPNDSLETKLADLNMLVLPGGRERSLDEFAALYAEAGFELVGSTRTESPLEVIEGRPV